MQELIDASARQPVAGRVIPTGVNRVMLEAIADRFVDPGCRCCPAARA